MGGLLDQTRGYLRSRQAAAWVARMDDDAARHEHGLRRWIGTDPQRAEAYNRAYRAFHSASAASRKIYAPSTQPAVRSVTFGSRRNLILISALSVLVASAALLFVLREMNTRGRHDQAVGQLYATRVGEVRAIRLADGSKLVVDTDTVVRVALSPTAREVTLEHGRVRFEVAHDAGRPFIVSAGGATITDIGTVFDVEAYRVVRVRLISGAVAITLPRTDRGPRPPAVHLVPGQQLGFDPAMTTGSEAPRLTPPSDLQWVSGMKTFDDVPVSEIIEEVNRYSATKIKLADPATGARRVFLDLDIRNSAEVARNLASYLRLEVDASEANALILRPQEVAREN